LIKFLWRVSPAQTYNLDAQQLTKSNVNRPLSSPPLRPSRLRGSLKKITTDQGCQFESSLFKQLTKAFGMIKFQTTPWPPCANGKIERWHRPLKSAIVANAATDQWTQVLPLILLGLQSSVDEDSVSPAQLTFGAELRLPRDFAHQDKSNDAVPPSVFAQHVWEAAEALTSLLKHHGKTPV
jgi:transposase InsO family protein